MRSLVGAGECGQVFLAEDEDGGLLAVKVLDEGLVNRPLLGKMTARLEEGGWPEGVMRVVSADFEEAPAIRVTAWHGDETVDPPRPDSLQHRLAEHPGEGTWPLVRELAKALAAMHARGVAHANLKPGNVFFDDLGRPLLTDWTLGNVPGIATPGFTDALLYQPPEQLRNASGYLEGEGFGWDVFSFGVLAFRLLTGKFPRCDDAFRLVAPPAGETTREGIQADLPKIAAKLESQPAAPWPDEPANELEAGYRAWIDRCLRLDPAQRPRTMAEVAAGLHEAETEAEAEAGREVLLDQRRAVGHRARRAYFFAGAATAAALLMAALWQLSLSQLKREKAERVGEVARLRTDLENARLAREAAEKEAATANRTVEYERDVALGRLEESRAIGDRLFDWAMEEGHRRLPPLDGRKLRLRRLERYFNDFLARTAELPELEDERGRVKLQLAEISLANGDPDEGRRRLEKAEVSTNSGAAGQSFRIARDRLWLALLMQSGGDPGAAEAFDEARAALQGLPETGVDSDRRAELLAVLDFHEAKLLAARGDDSEALLQLLRATETLNRLADQRPDSVVLRSELAECYLSAATILEGIGSLGDARAARAQAAAELTKLIEKSPEDVALRLELAGCYGAMAESAILSGDVAAAETYSLQALGLLDGVLRKEPENADAVARRAAQLGLQAGLMRDRGDAEEAVAAFDRGIRALEAVRASNPDNPTVAYRLALLWWQKGRMLGFADDRKGEIGLISRARDLLSRLEGESHPAGPPMEQLQRSQGYVLGDLGHALQLAGEEAKAREVFREAVEMWKRLNASRPSSEEYEESLEWCLQRLKELE